VEFTPGVRADFTAMGNALTPTDPSTYSLGAPIIDATKFTLLPVVFPFWFLDTTVSFASDTILLPVDALKSVGSQKSKSEHH
jgi:hypothetical protein